MNARARVRGWLRPAYHRILGPLPHDPTRGWPATTAPGEPALRVAYYGDCMFRAMDHSHGVHTPVGWPRVLAERLLERGERMEWSTVFMTEFDHLPGREDLGHYLRLSDVPDVVFVALGTRYANLAVLPETPAMLRLREDIGRRLGRHAITGYRLQRPLMRVFGRPAAPYGGAAGLERFLTAVRDEWPDVPVALITPPPRLDPLAVQRAIEARVVADARAVCRRTGVECLDITGVLGDDPRVRAANGYNLSTAGSELAGEHLADWLLSRRTGSASTTQAVGSAY